MTIWWYFQQTICFMMWEMVIRFDQDVDRESNFKHSTVLAMPIKHAGSPGRVLGVFQLVNKFDNLPFTRYTNYTQWTFGIFEEGGKQIWQDQGFIFSTSICLILRGSKRWICLILRYWGGAKGVASTQHNSDQEEHQANQVFLDNCIEREQKNTKCFLKSFQCIQLILWN